jgi:hypothetical protein
MEKQAALPLSQVKNVDTPLVKQVLTVQLQVYFEKITNAIQSTEKQVQDLAIESLSGDPGIQALMPYFVIFLSDQVHFFTFETRLPTI